MPGKDKKNQKNTIADNKEKEVGIIVLDMPILNTGTVYGSDPGWSKDQQRKGLLHGPHHHR